MSRNLRSGKDVLRDIDWIEHPIRRKIISYIIESGENGSSISELSSNIGSLPSLCAYHLGLMRDRGLVENVVCRKEGRRDYSFYIPTPRCLHLIAIGEELSREGGPEPARELPNKIVIVSWGNLPRCFVHGRLG
ncbi:MAG: winged helix-turn-helix domain-containing protein [Candidatus Thermoplasmatota archaeon]|nr:winged helix-turn-helix domain-containing protein [Candidatus Thermoplasmatota archaeon]